jgi:putative peptide zinc metalloprotease protein
VSRYGALSLVRDGDGYVLGSRYSRDFVAVPAIGGDVVRWLQEGYSVEECARRAEERIGEPVDVAGFVEGLASAGLLPEAEEEVLPAPPAWTVHIGRILFGPAGLAVQAALTLTAAAVMLAVPRLRPAYNDAIVSGVPLVSFVVVALVATASGLVHECAHVLAAAARGVPGRISISRRMVTLVYQTDLTRLWSVPRRTRVVPLLAGLLSDAATVGVLVLVELVAAPPLVRALVFVKVAGIVFQLEVFMRTDLYALFVLATGCRNLWGTKGAVARRAIGRASAEDRALLETVDRKEIRWARVYLFLYLPGVLWTAWYFTVFAVPALRRLVAMSLDAVAAHGPLNPLGVAGLLAIVVTVASTGFVLWGVARTAVRLVRMVV